jgi:murein DD-endopeptidase MepM/ murein hydrolase activator NlpD
MKVKIKIRQRQAMSRSLLLLLILILFAAFLVLSFVQKEEPAVEEKPKPPETSIPATPPPLEVTRIIIKKGATFSDILSPFGFTPAEIHKLREDVKPVYDLAKIKAGQESKIFSNQDGEVVSLEYVLDQDNILHIDKLSGGYEAVIKKIPYHLKVKTIWGSIEENLILAVIRENEKDFLALALAEIFAWDIDFYTDLRQGDSFKIIFEKKYLEDKFITYGNILAAEFTNQGQTYQAYRFVYSDTGEADYFDLEGDSLRKEFLKSPIKFARITSRFSYSRRHPIRKVYRPHYGVDYAARPGTPVQATADGTVTIAGWNGASGRMIRIRHKNAYETMYLHLRGYAKGIKKGAKVQGGQVIGYVGTSGESTGPHLDYRIKYRGSYINPLAWRFRPVKPLRKEFSEEFKAEADCYRFLLEAPFILFARLSFRP